MAVSCLLHRYTKTTDWQGNLKAAHVDLRFFDPATGDNLLWGYDLSPAEVAALVADATSIVTVLNTQGTLGLAAYNAQISPPPVPQVQASPHLATINGNTVTWS